MLLFPYWIQLLHLNFSFKQKKLLSLQWELIICNFLCLALIICSAEEKKVSFWKMKRLLTIRQKNPFNWTLFWNNKKKAWSFPVITSCKSLEKLSVCKKIFFFLMSSPLTRAFSIAFVTLKHGLQLCQLLLYPYACASHFGTLIKGT